MTEHVRPSCPLPEYAEPPEEELTVSYRLAVRLEAVHRVLVDGKTETRFEPKLVLVGGTEDDESPTDLGDVDDIPF